MNLKKFSFIAIKNVLLVLIQKLKIKILKSFHMYHLVSIKVITNFTCFISS